MITKIIQYQIEQGITQDELSEKIGVSKKSIYNARRGKCSESTLKKIAEFCEKNNL